MNAQEVWDRIGNETSPEMKVIIEVGGDGAIHQGFVNSIIVDHEAKTVTLSSEQE